MESCGSIEEGCTTPKHLMPEAFQCPPPPRKKSRGESKREPPKNGYFQPPDLDSLFTMNSILNRLWIVGILEGISLFTHLKFLSKLVAFHRQQLRGPGFAARQTHPAK
ncbi:hypothetical protein Goshw_014515 [Gossypium schwendimanii]|uniref:Uncharacterized protein n=3 Tax=Gossypium TaxID=3633 RepID=A0A7J9MQ19_GOSSC|nr:hypothetical protein [Gossypium schwendimanii]